MNRVIGTTWSCQCGREYKRAVVSIDHVNDARRDRDRWIRLFNRLEGAVAHHGKAKASLFVDEADEALHAAHQAVLKQAARGETP